MRTTRQRRREHFMLTTASAVVIALFVSSRYGLCPNRITSIRTTNRTKLRSASPFGGERASTNATAVHGEESISTKKKKPTLVLHIGPGKTATKTVQRELCRLESALNEDGYTFQGKGCKNSTGSSPPILSALKYTCFRELEEALHTKQSPPQCWLDFRRDLERFYGEGKSVIISDEYFSHRDKDLTMFYSSPLFKEELADWNVLFIVTYRRFWSWLLSGWNQKMVRIKRYWDATNKAWEFCRPNGTEHERLPTWLSDVNISQWKYTNETAKELSVQNISILNYHDAKDIVSTLLCDVLPNASISCHESLQRKDPPVLGPASDHVYDAIVCAAGTRGLVEPESYKSVIEMAQTFHQTEVGKRPLPLDCPNEPLLQSLFDESKQLEKQLVPEFYRSSDQEEHHREFLQYANEKKFCSVDTAAVLSDPSWVSFFEQFRTA